MGDDQVDSLHAPLLDQDRDEEVPVEPAEIVPEAEEELEPGEDNDEPARSSQAEDQAVLEASTVSFLVVFWQRVLRVNLLPDDEWTIRGKPLVEGIFSVKLLKFVALTMGSIFILHWLVSFRGDHRDTALKTSQIWVFDGGLIVRDSVLFFVVGRLWRQRGVDHLAFVSSMVLSNLYFESQHYIHFLEHAFTLYEMHCTWPWQLWLFVALIVPLLVTVVGAHVVQAYREGALLLKSVELSICVLLFLVPVIASPYFHFHHWFAGWLLGMHCNFDIWWSRATMAWCWGMYVNGIAVYGRDPVLTCEYAYFLTVDQQCHYTDCYTHSLASGVLPDILAPLVEKMTPADWRNCSAQGYHP